MAVIVAFGDSNTWGYDPATGARLAPEARWTGVMASALGPEHRVIEEGLNGRTTVFVDPIEPDRRGADYLAPCLRSHAPLELLIIALGCNDMKARFHVSAAEIALGAERLVLMARAEPVGPRGAPPRMLLVAPPPIARLTAFADMFRGAEPKSREIAARYAEVAERREIGLVDAGQFIRCSDLDGIHYEADQHAILGQAMAEAVKIMMA
jgi:lysophospholipase L1-like esterase